MYSKNTPDDGQRNCPKHVEFYSKNKFQKLVHLVGFIIRMLVLHQSVGRNVLLINLFHEYSCLVTMPLTVASTPIILVGTSS